MRRDEGGVAVKLALVGVFWGAAYVAGRFVMGEMAPWTAIAVRFAIATVCLLTILALLPEKDRAVNRADLPGLVGLGLVGVLGFNLLFFLGLSSTGAVNATLVGAATPAVTALLAAFVLGERLRAAQWAGIGLSLAGAVAVITNGSLAAFLALSFNPGDLLIAAAGVAWAVYTVAGNRLFQRYRPITVTAYTYVAAASLVLPLAAGSAAISGVQDLDLSGWTWGALLFLGTVSSVLGFIWWNEGVAVLGPSRTGIFNNLVPVSGLVLGSVLLGEAVTPVHLAGAGLVIAGVLLTVRGE